MRSEPFTGIVSQMKGDVPWLASEDMIGLRPRVMVIAAVVRYNDVKMDGGRTEAELFALHFVETTKGMILNATNRKFCAKAFGASTKQWIGKQVEIFVQDGVRKPGGAKGETTTGLRLRLPTGSNPLNGGEPL